MSGSDRRHERGSIAPLILVFFLVAALLVMGTAAAGSAFLAQRDLQAVCDGAALAAADALDEVRAYAHDNELTDLPLSGGSVEAAVTRYRRAGYARDPTLAPAAQTDGRQVTVTCRRVVRIPFGAAFGYGDGLGRTAVSTALAPLN